MQFYRKWMNGKGYSPLQKKKGREGQENRLHSTKECQYEIILIIFLFFSINGESQFVNVG